MGAKKPEFGAVERMRRQAIVAATMGATVARMRAGRTCGA